MAVAALAGALLSALTAEAPSDAELGFADRRDNNDLMWRRERAGG
jgi:hypothetical protein